MKKTKKKNGNIETTNVMTYNTIAPSQLQEPNYHSYKKRKHSSRWSWPLTIPLPHRSTVVFSSMSAVQSLLSLPPFIYPYFFLSLFPLYILHTTHRCVIKVNLFSLSFLYAIFFFKKKEGGGGGENEFDHSASMYIFLSSTS